jgi:hypothetical protein
LADLQVYNKNVKISKKLFVRVKYVLVVGGQKGHKKTKKGTAIALHAKKQ